MSDSPHDRPWQFSLKHLLALVLVVGLVFGVYRAAGLFGVVLLGLAVGMLLLVHGILHRRFASTALGSVILGLMGAMLCLGINVAVGDGRTQLPCTITVTDATTGRVIPAASVRIRNARDYETYGGVPRLPIPSGEQGVSGQTDAQGTVTLLMEFWVSTYSGTFVDRTTYFIDPAYWIQVEAPGYERALVPMQGFTGGSGYDKRRLPLPTMPIVLERLPPPTADPADNPTPGP